MPTQNIDGKPSPHTEAAYNLERDGLFNPFRTFEMWRHDRKRVRSGAPLKTLRR